ncbi:hypothetical protein [Anatilimnocola aggregata]|nr:hypothetical protein [Anatilimnocola aggregata]
MLEVQPTQPNGNPWDTGIGAFARPDPQVTMMRNDPKLLQVATDMLIDVMEQRMKDLGRPVPPRFREVFARGAMTSLRCGKSLEALQNPELTAIRGKFASDTTVASDSLLTKLVDGGMKVAVDDNILIFVNDTDLAAHDLMGQTELKITKDLLAKGEVELKFNSVDSLRLKLLPIAD